MFALVFVCYFVNMAEGRGRKGDREHSCPLLNKSQHPAWSPRAVLGWSCPGRGSSGGQAVLKRFADAVFIALYAGDTAAVTVTLLSEKEAETQGG